MKLLLFLLLPLLIAANIPTSASHEKRTEAAVKIYIFVAETCPICQYYTAKINQISEDYPQYEIVLVFPNALSSEATMEKFKKKYKLTASMQLDPEHSLVQKFGVTVTPEVVVYDQTNEMVQYQGRIDDNYYRVGQRKTHIQSDDLLDALNAIKNNTAIVTVKTQPVGCFISQKPTK